MDKGLKARWSHKHLIPPAAVVGGLQVGLSPLVDTELFESRECVFPSGHPWELSRGPELCKSHPALTRGTVTIQCPGSVEQLILGHVSLCVLKDPIPATLKAWEEGRGHSSGCPRGLWRKDLNSVYIMDNLNPSAIADNPYWALTTHPPSSPAGQELMYPYFTVRTVQLGSPPQTPQNRSESFFLKSRIPWPTRGNPSTDSSHIRRDMGEGNRERWTLSLGVWIGGGAHLSSWNKPPLCSICISSIQSFFFLLDSTLFQKGFEEA